MELGGHVVNLRMAMLMRDGGGCSGILGLYSQFTERVTHVVLAVRGHHYAAAVHH